MKLPATNLKRKSALQLWTFPSPDSMSEAISEETQLQQRRVCKSSGSEISGKVVQTDAKLTYVDYMDSLRILMDHASCDRFLFC